MIKKLLIVLLLSIMALAEKHAPMPDRLMNAKTLYIDNQSGVAETADRAYDEFSKWNRFKIVTDRGQADLIFLIEVDPGTSGEHGTVSTYNSGTQSVQTSSIHTSGQNGATKVRVIDQRTGDTLWAQTKPFAFKSATRKIVKELRKRMEEKH
jgi:hypothetical protein